MCRTVQTSVNVLPVGTKTVNKEAQIIPRLHIPAVVVFYSSMSISGADSKIPRSGTAAAPIQQNNTPDKRGIGARTQRSRRLRVPL